MRSWSHWCDVSLSGAGGAERLARQPRVHERAGLCECEREREGEREREREREIDRERERERRRERERKGTPLDSPEYMNEQVVTLIQHSLNIARTLM